MDDQTITQYSHSNVALVELDTNYPSSLTNNRNNKYITENGVLVSIQSGDADALIAEGCLYTDTGTGILIWSNYYHPTREEDKQCLMSLALNAEEWTEHRKIIEDNCAHELDNSDIEIIQGMLRGKCIKCGVSGALELDWTEFSWV